MRRWQGGIVLAALGVLALSAVASLPVAWAMPHHSEARFTVPTRTPTVRPTAPVAQPTRSAQPTAPTDPSSTVLPATPTAGDVEPVVTAAATREAGVAAAPSMPSATAELGEVATAEPTPAVRGTVAGATTEGVGVAEPESVPTELLPAISESVEGNDEGTQMPPAKASARFPWMPGLGALLLMVGGAILIAVRRR